MGVCLWEVGKNLYDMDQIHLYINEMDSDTWPGKKYAVLF